MTDRIHSLTVVLEKNMRDDDVQCVIDAIKMVRCVGDVVPHVADGETYMAESRAKEMWGQLLYKFLRCAHNHEKFAKLKKFIYELAEESP